MKALRPWRNMEFEGDVQRGQLFIVPEHRAKELEIHGLAVRDDGIFNNGNTVTLLDPLLVHGMHGLGDNLHQRAVIRQLMKTNDVWLESSWVAPYHDLIADGLKVVQKSTALRTQSKNSTREASRFYRSLAPPYAKQIQVSYSIEQVRRQGSVLGAMLAMCGCDNKAADFRLPIQSTWQAKAQRLIEKWKPTKPIMLYRPLVQRTEWGGCAARNPDHYAYAHLFASIRERFFVVGIADLVPNVEWLVGCDFDLDAKCYAGELEFETLAALTQKAALMFCSPGFAVILAQAVGTPVVTVFGGFENSKSFSAGAKFAPYLGIDPVVPCDCFQHTHNCRKQIDLDPAAKRIKAFVDEFANGSEISTGRERHKLGRTVKAVYEPRRTRSADRANPVGASEGRP